ncbi:unnamed protein product [Brachionus calyciflorus]|uniref:FAM65 N-terminal domain-containing protein n=1 Tax=Brachionus calyciflorus TaxID=104777 RepID=A0A813P7L5_9BILA|nr:unnamed protein product [Brachionus calyciflorus]
MFSSNTELALSSSSSAYSSPPGSPFISILNPITTPVIGQKRRKSSKQTIPPSLSSNNMSTILNNSAYSYEQVTSTLNRSPSTYQATSTLITTNSARVQNLKITVPKSPKPQRTLLILDSVITGLNLCIDDLRNKVAELTLAVTNGYNAMAKQLLQSEAYLRHLELRISNLLKLKNSYIIHLKMRDGIQNMYDAYKKSPSKNQIKNLANIKSGWKECVKTLCLIEAQTEALLGSFRFQIEKLIGFARLCPGDVYQLQIKYGTNSKFRTRTKISKDCNQIWDNKNFLFKITIHELLLIKINEIKFFGKNVSIGERYFDIKDLFSTTQTQRLTLNANTSGSIKLSMLITWMPFENCEDNFTYYNPTQLINLKNKDKVNSIPKSSSFNQNDYSLQQTIQIRPTSFLSGQINESKISNLSSIIDDDGDSKLGTSISSSSTSSKNSDNLNISLENRLSIKSISSNDTTNSFEYSERSESSHLSNESFRDDISHQVESVLNDLIEKIEMKEPFDVGYESLKNNLNDLRSNYIELNDFYECLILFESLFKKEEIDKDSVIETERISLSLEDNVDGINLDEVLHEYFDFLNLENDSDSIRLLSSISVNNININKSINSKASNGLVKIFDYDLLFLNHFKSINRLLDDLNLVNKTQFSSEKLNKNQPKFEQVIIDLLANELELLKNIHKFLNRPKEILTDEKEDLINSLNNFNDENFSNKKTIWLKSITMDNKESFFCAKTKFLKDNLLNFFNPDALFSNLFEKILDKYFQRYSFKLQSDNFLSLYYFDLVFDLLYRVNMSIKSKSENFDLQDIFQDVLLSEETSEKISVIQILFNVIINEIYAQDNSKISSSLRNFVESNRTCTDLILGYIVEHLEHMNQSQTAILINYLNDFLK